MARRSVVLGAWVGLALTAIEPRAGAQVRSLRWDGPVDVAVTLAGAGAWLVGSQSSLHATCRWCSGNDLDAAARSALKWSNPRSADIASDATGFMMTPIGVLTADAIAASRSGGRGIPVDGLLIAEATVLAVDACLLAKILVRRRRPNGSDNLSFFSGHTTTAFALAAASGTVATLRGYRSAPLVWVVGGVGAAITGYMRIAADYHWLTDVIVGAVVGTGVGIAVPYSLHRPVAAGPRAVSSPLLVLSF